MADSMKGERATCDCGAEGEIVAQSDPLDMSAPWFVVRHETVVHVTERFWTGEAFRFRRLA